MHGHRRYSGRAVPAVLPACSALGNNHEIRHRLFAVCLSGGGDKIKSTVTLPPLTIAHRSHDGTQARWLPSFTRSRAITPPPTLTQYVQVRAVRGDACQTPLARHQPHHDDGRPCDGGPRCGTVSFGAFPACEHASVARASVSPGVVPPDRFWPTESNYCRQYAPTDRI